MAVPEADPNSVSAGLVCRVCGEPARSLTAWRCDCGEPFRLLDNPEHSRFAALQIPELGQGETPLIPAPFEGAGRLHLKLEGANPSGSFKDRGMAVLVGLAVKCGAPEVVCDSSGNAAAAIAAFASAAGIGCRVFVPAETSEGKLRQIEAYGADLVRVPGDREDAARAAQAAANESFYASHYWHPCFALGTRSFAYEVIEQFSGNPPDHVVFPVGHGSLYLGAVSGFLSAARDWNIAPPRCHVVQTRACQPVVQAVSKSTAPAKTVTTIAEGIRIPEPLRLPEILTALGATGGCALAVEEDSILHWWRRSARGGVLMEPTSAVALAGLEALHSEGVIGDKETVVVPVTGHGLKVL